MSKFPIVIKNRLIEQVEILMSNIEVSDFPPDTRGGLYDRALLILKAWRNGDIDTDDLLEETYIIKKNDTYIALQTIAKDMADRQSERNKENINRLKQRMLDMDKEGEDFNPS
jgi:hypothetical protein